MTNSYPGSRLVAFSMATPDRVAWHAPGIIPSIILLIDEETEGGGNPVRTTEGAICDDS